MVAIVGRKVPVGPYNVPQQNGIGDVLSGFAKPYINTLDGDLKRAKLAGAEREEGAISELAGMDFTSGGLDNQRAISAAIRAGMDPKNLGGYRQYGVVQRDGPGTDAALRAIMSVPGANYGNTVQGTREDLANRRAIQSMADSAATDRAVRVKDMDLTQIIGADGQPQYQRAGQSVGQRPVLDLSKEQGVFAARNADRIPDLKPSEQNFISAESTRPTPYGYVTPDGRRGTGFTAPNGIVDAQTGEKLPQGTEMIRLEGATTEGLGGSKLTNDITQRRVATRQLTSAIDRLDQLLAAPNADQAVGWVGKAAGFFNDIRAQYEGAVRALGGLTARQEVDSDPELQQAISRVMRDPTVSEMVKRLGAQEAVLKSQVVDLAYAMAKAKDPGGRMSDQDIIRAHQIIAGSSQDPQVGRQVLSDLKARALSDQHIWEEEFSRTRAGTRGAAPGMQTGSRLRYNPATGQVE